MGRPAVDAADSRPWSSLSPRIGHPKTNGQRAIGERLLSWLRYRRRTFMGGMDGHDYE